ncbi:MAG: hypothetical protein KIT89_10755 [Microcella sp.]|uniref:hypothetical protein n=1 Tax=Microcella sp. TaxID=1913979 RepID=UPI0024C69B99|nr:hypothetical protein [Microcella sp.]UYN83172.1 MAG: hypothetical protein KIT89_10755 [Microcella sp.]
MESRPDTRRAWLLPVEGEFARFSTILYRVLFWQSARVVWDQILVNHDGEESIRDRIARRDVTTHSLARYPIVDAPKWGPVQVYQRVFRIDGDHEKALGQRSDGEAGSPAFPDHEKMIQDHVRKLVPDDLNTAEPISESEVLTLLAEHRHVGQVGQQVEAVVHDLVGRGATYIIGFAKALARLIDERQRAALLPEQESKSSLSTDVFAIAWSLLRDRPIDGAMIDGEDWASGELLLNAATTAYFDLTGKNVNLDLELLAALESASTKLPQTPLSAAPAPGSLATPERVAAHIAEWKRTLEYQRKSPGAPASLRDGDPWWDPAIFRRWYTVRLLFGVADLMTEELWVISLPEIGPHLPLAPGVVSVRYEVDSFVAWRAAMTPGELLRSEVTNTGWHQNNTEVLNLKRRFGGTVEEYRARYVDSL